MTEDRKISLFHILLFAVALSLSVPLVLGFLGRLHPGLDSFSHLRMHLAAGMAILALPLLFSVLRREGVMLLLFAVMAFSTTLSTAQTFLGGARAASLKEVSAPYSLLQINLRYDNDDPKKFLQLVGREKPDVITYQEASANWMPWLDILSGSYPYRLNCSKQRRTWGVGILSRRPFSENGMNTCVGEGLLAMATVNFGGTDVNIASLHFSWPWPRWQPYQLAYVEPSLRTLSGPTIVAGDLNATPWSDTVRRVERASGTVHLSGIGASWIARQLPVTLAPYLGFPIDQVLVSSTIEALHIGTTTDAGSDHLPVRFDFTVPPPERQPDEPQTLPNTESVMLNKPLI